METEFTQKKTNTWKIATIVLGVLLVISLFANGIPFTGYFVKDSKVNSAVDFINTNLLADGTKAELKQVDEISGLYKIKLSIDGQEFDSYISKDGKFLFPSAIDLSMKLDTASPTATEQTTVEIPKNDKPVIELFVMSHCPYGTQIEKGIIPVIELLGNKVDFNLRFVYYAMHGEKEVKEELNQYCIQKEQEDKFIPYLKCFLGEGNTEKCLTEVKIDKTKLTKCVESTDKQFDVTKNLNDQASWLSGKFPLFNVDKELNDKYGIGGSPTLIINGVEASSGRSSSELLSVVCNAFSENPSECEKELSTTSPSAGFGYAADTGSGSSGSCG